MLVLGVDPGSRATGYGLVEKDGQRIRCIDAGVIESPGRKPFPERIHAVYHSMVEIMSLHHPGQMAIEDMPGGRSWSPRSIAESLFTNIRRLRSSRRWSDMVEPPKSRCGPWSK
jgi:hypothetical protein